MTDDMNTRPTIETVLERIGAFDQKVDDRINALERKIDDRFDKVDNEIDRLASVAYSTKAEMVTLRADFREWRAQVKEALPVLQES